MFQLERKSKSDYKHTTENVYFIEEIIVQLYKTLARPI